MKIITVTVALVILISLFVYSVKFYDITFFNDKATMNNNQISDMVTRICDGDYDLVYTNKEFKNQGVYQCDKNSYVYYVNYLKKIVVCICVEIYMKLVIRITKI